MSLAEPLFGPIPVESSVPQVEAVCVNHYPASATRPHIWEGFLTVHSRIVNEETIGKLWVSGDFVVDHEDPHYAQVHLRVPASAPKHDGLLDLISWLNNKEQTERLACDITAIVEYSRDDPAYPYIMEYAQIVLDDFSAHGDKEKKGFPIIPLP